MAWWKLNQGDYPRMTALAKYHLSIPASSAFSERCFSFAGNTRSIKRTNISDEKLEMMRVLKTIGNELWSIVENVKLYFKPFNNFRISAVPVTFVLGLIQTYPRNHLLCISTGKLVVLVTLNLVEESWLWQRNLRLRKR